jgi:hypothetical protein
MPFPFHDRKWIEVPFEFDLTITVGIGKEGGTVRSGNLGNQQPHNIKTA